MKGSRGTLGASFHLAALHSHPIQYFAPLYRRIAQQSDIDLTVYYCSRQGAEEYNDADFGARFKWDTPLLEGYRHFFLPNVRRGDRVAGFFSLINPEIVCELRRGNFDALLVHGHGYFTYVLAIIAARISSVPVLMRNDTHLLLKRSRLKRILRAPVMGALYRMCNACLPIGARNAEFYRAHGVKEGQLFHVPYTVDNHYFVRRAELCRKEAAATRAQLGLPPSKPLVLYASKLTPRKRCKDLLKAFQLVRAQGLDAALGILGAGSEEETLRVYVQEQKIPDVYFWGFRNQSELPKFYAMADVFVLPSENEPWGLVINEVMCAGLPVITTFEVGAAADLVKHGYNGYLYPSGDTAMLAKHLGAIVANPELRHQMGQNSRRLISDWSIEQSVQGIRAALDYVSSRNIRQVESA